MLCVEVLMVRLAYLLVLLSFVGSVLCSSGVVVGCGGFIELSPALAAYHRNHPDIPIDFSDVKIRLTTTEGLEKYSTECAPNGYYFIPVYEKGDFVIHMEGRDGWIATPDKTHVSVDDAECNGGKDINFGFTGFEVSGQVISDTTHCQTCQEGPSGVTISLSQSTDTSNIISTTTTNQNGLYSFTNTPPGNYIVTASHPVWSFNTDTVEIEVGLGKLEVSTSLVVDGYDVNGNVEADGEPIFGVEVYLVSDDVPTIDVCEGVEAPAEIASATKHVTSPPPPFISFPRMLSVFFLFFFFVSCLNIRSSPHPGSLSNHQLSRWLIFLSICPKWPLHPNPMVPKRNNPL